MQYNKQPDDLAKNASVKNILMVIYSCYYLNFELEVGSHALVQPIGCCLPTVPIYYNIRS